MLLSKPYMDEKWLKDQYEKGWTVGMIAQKCGVSRGAIKYWMDKFKVKKRPWVIDTAIGIQGAFEVEPWIVKKCKKCGGYLPMFAKYCMYCGAKLD